MNWKLSYLIFTLFISVVSNANAPLKADQSFKSKLYNEAANLYEEETKKDSYAKWTLEDKEELQLKWTQSLMLSGMYEKALTKINDLRVTEKSKNYPFYILLKVKSFEKYLTQYRYQMQATEIEGEKDILKKSPTYFESEIQNLTQILWDRKEKYLSIVITENLYLFDLKNADTETLPTFYDYLIYQFQNQGMWQRVKNFNLNNMLKEASSITVTSEEAKSLVTNFSPSEINKKRSYIKEKWLMELKKREFQALLYPQYDFEFNDSKDEKEKLSKENPHSEKINAFIKELKNLRAQSEWYVVMSKNELKNKNLEKSYAYCEKAIDLYKSQLTSECFEIQRMIANKEIVFSHSLFDSEQEINLNVRIRNFNKIYIRLYEVPFDGSWNKVFADFKSANELYLDREKIKKWLTVKPLVETEVNSNGGKKYFYNEVVVPLSKRPAGRYVVLVSEGKNFEFEKEYMAGSYVWVSDLVMLTQTAIEFNPEKSIGVKEITQLPSQHFYYFNSITGKLEKGVNLLYSMNYKAEQELAAQNEKTTLKDDWDFTGQQRLGYGNQLYALAYKGKSFSFLNQYIGKNHQQRVNIIIEKDRPIYRPGQKMMVKLMALQRVPFGWQVMPLRRVTVNIKDANYKQAHTVDLELNDMGSATTSFEIPKTALLGNYHIEVILKDQEINLTNVAKNFTEYFKVEEYKRPDFFVEIPKVESALIFNKPVKLKIKAKYYHGSPVKKAQVDYSIGGQVYWPWFYRPYFYDMDFVSPSAAPIHLTGKGETDDKGELEISFTPESKGEAPLSYLLTANVRDTGGRTISETQSFYANKSEYLIQLSTEKNFYFSHENLSYQVELKDLNENKFSGEVSLVLSELQPPTPEQIKKMKDKEMTPPYEDGYFPQHRRFSYSRFYPEKDITFYLKDLDRKEVEKKSLKVAKDKMSAVSFSKLKEGFYHVKVTGEDTQKVKIENEAFIMVYNDGARLSTFYIPKLTVLDKKSYKVGEKVNVIFGSSKLMADAVVNVLRAQFLGQTKIYNDKSKIRLFEFKTEEHYQRNATFVWFGWGEKKILQDSEIIEIQPYNKKLALELNYKKELRPGDKQEVKFKVEDANSHLEGLLKVYDQSLEFYSKDSKNRFFELYSADESSQLASAFEFNPQTVLIPEKINVFSTMIEAFRKSVNLKLPPRLNVDLNDFHYYGRGGGMRILEDSLGGAGIAEADSVSAKGIMPQVASMAPAMKVKSESKFAANEMQSSTEPRQTSSSDKAKEVAAPEDKVQVRSDFSETAVFEPFVNFKGKTASVDFKLPDQLTTWKLNALVVSKNGRLEDASGTFITNKALMTKLQIPRFFREKDISEIRVFVENKSKGELAGTVKLILEQEGKDVYSFFSKEPNKQNWKLKAGDQASLVWKVQIPSRLTDLKIKAVGMAGAETDAEEKVIPLLPSRERLIETQISFLSDKKKTILKMPKWNEKDETRLHEQMVVQIDPQLPLMLLNSIPGLINYPYSCSEQLINKFVPLAILNSLYDKNPKLKAALKKVPPRTTLNLPWEDNDPRRLISLMETPWKQISEGLTTPYELIQLLDAEQVEKIKRYVFTELQNRQLSSGGFPWFAGGKEDLYITLIILEGFSEALKYDVEIPKDMVSKALDYVYRELPKYLKAEQYELQFLIYGAYVFSSFDGPPLKLSKNKEALNSWVPFIEKYEHLITPLGQAYMAHIYHRMDKKDKSQLALKKAFDGMKTDELIGSYWAPEEKSWLWYSDSVEKHTFFIQTLVELRPQDERIKDLVKWLLFNRKGNEWKSTKTSAKAIYSILRFMKAGGALDKNTLVDMKWGDTNKKIEIDPFEFKKDPLRFIKTENFKPNDGTIEFKKTGGLPVIASSTWIYTTDQINTSSSSSVLSLERQFYQVKGVAGKQTLAPIPLEGKIKVGDEVEVQLKIKAKSQLEYIHLRDPRGAGFEANQLLSGYVWDLLSRYEEPRDSLTNFFISWLPKGEYILKHRFKATTKGKYKFGSAVIQSMYSPDMSAYSSGMILEIE